MKIIGLTLIKNEEKKFLKEWIDNNEEIMDFHIFLDNGSNDNTIDIIKNTYKTKHVIISDQKEFASNEQYLRNKLWEECRKYATDKDWICVIDADELLDKKQMILLKKDLPTFNQKIEGIKFNLLDMWNDKEFRYDGMWSPSKYPLMFRYKNEKYSSESKFSNKLHAGRNPEYVDDKKFIHSHINILHMPYTSDKLRKEKYNFYTKNAPNNILKNHALSILDTKPELKKIYNGNFNEKIMICSLINNRQWFLKYFLNTILSIDYDKNNIVYYFVVNNSHDDVFKLIEEFKKTIELKWNINIEVIIDVYNFDITKKHEREWSTSLLHHMGIMRNMCLNKSKELKCDFLFTIDSDIVVPKYLLKQLIARELPVVSPVFFAKWSINNCVKNKPQLKGLNWEKEDEHKMYCYGSKFYEVGLLGAITLINMKYIGNKIDYSFWRNNQFWGEDANFCTKLSIEGIKLYGDSSFDITHLDNEDDFKNNLKYLINDNFNLISLDWDFKRRTLFGSNNLFLILLKVIKYKLFIIMNAIKCGFKIVFSIRSILQ